MGNQETGGKRRTGNRKRKAWFRLGAMVLVVSFLCTSAQYGGSRAEDASAGIKEESLKMAEETGGRRYAAAAWKETDKSGGITPEAGAESNGSGIYGGGSEAAGETAVPEEESVVYHLFDNEQAVTVSDRYFGKQWALYNDGSFTYQGGGGLSGYSLDYVSGWWHPEAAYSGSAGRYTASAAAKAGIDIRMNEAWALYNGGVREVIVAVIDTGIDNMHEDLRDVFWINEDEIPDDGIDNDGNGFADDVYGWNFYDNTPIVYVGQEDDHGTHGAGTIAARLNGIGIAGIAGSSPVKIMIVKALGGAGGTGSTEAVLRAIRYAEQNGAVICNLSFGTTMADSRLRKAIAESDMLFVAAAGNGDKYSGVGYDVDISPIYPASYDLDNVISVANLQPDGTLHISSNYGVDSVDLAAPGTYVLSTTPGSTYSYMSGTSMAAPMVTAAAALLYSQYPDISLKGVKEILLNTVRPLDSLSGLTGTGGMLDVAAALEYDISVLGEYQPGTAPIIRTLVWEGGSGMRLTVKVTDLDGDLTMVRYMAGVRTAEDFAGGAAGKSFRLNTEGKKRFTPLPGRTYTFYAKDSKGNEAVKTVTATIMLD